MSYYLSQLIISNQTSSSIDFFIKTMHGRDGDHVNIGQLKGKAKKVDVPEASVIADAMQTAYQFEETIDGKTYKITFIHTFFRMFDYVNIIEDYPDFINPYGGHGVYFAGDYQIVD